MSDQIPFPLPPSIEADLHPDTVLQEASRLNIDPVIVVGLDKDGRLYVASSLGNSDTVLGLMYRATSWLAQQANAL